MKNVDPATAAALAAFAAKGGTVTRVSIDATNGMTDRQWYKAARDSDNRKVVEDYSVEEALSEREREIGMAHGVAGVNDFRSGLRQHGAKRILGWEK